MERTEFEAVLRSVCGDEIGGGSKLARMIGTSPATISRWRSGEVPISHKDAMLLRLIVYLTERRIGWRKIGRKPVRSVEGIL